MEINQTFDRLSRLSNITMALSAGMELNKFLDTLVKSVKESIDADEAYIMLLDRDSYELIISSVSGPKRKRPKKIKCLDRRVILNLTDEFGLAPCPINKTEKKNGELKGESLMLFNAFNSKQRLLYSGNMFDPIFSESPQKNALIIPLQTISQCVGLLIIGNLKKQATFTVNDLEEATIFANIAAMHIEHNMLKEEHENRIKEMEKLNILAKKFSSTQTLEGLIGLSFEYLSQLIPHKLGIVCLFEKNTETRYFVSESNLGPLNLKTLSKHIDIVSEGIATKKPSRLISQQIFLPSEDKNQLKKVCRKKLQSFLTVPLILRGTNIGLINISSESSNAFTRENMQIFSTLANLLSTAVENVKVRIYLERRVDEISVLFEITQAINSTLVLDEVLSSIVNFSMELLGALRCELRLIDETKEKLIVKASRGLSQSFLASADIKVGEGIIGGCFSQKTPISVVDARRDPRTKYTNIAREEKLAGLLAVPITQRGKSIGVITTYTSEPRDFTQEEIDLISTFASQASIAIENAKLYAEMKRQYLSMVMALAAAIEAKDSYTHGHSTKVMEYAVKISREIGLSDEKIDTIRYAGLLHDIGKIGIKDVILTKQGKLTEEEIKELHRHPEYGANIMESVEMLKEIAPLTLYHHEKFDGTGYPLGLRGTQIPLGARILAVADTFDAMIADRPYRKAFPFSHVQQEMRKVAGTQLDPELVNIFFEILHRESNT